MDEIRDWVEDSPDSSFLGVRLEHLDASRARLVLSYRDENSNPGKALHGGCAASLGAIGGRAVAHAALGPESGPWHTAQMQVSYLAAASAGDHGESDPGPMGPHIGKVPFIGQCGIRVEHLTGGTSRRVMPDAPENADLAGGVHEGAMLALLDTTGAMGSWAETGPGPYKASTVSIRLQNLAPRPRRPTSSPSAAACSATAPSSGPTSTSPVPPVAAWSRAGPCSTGS